MTRGIDLTQLNKVATAGEPHDSVPVTRRFLAQVYAELHASRAGRAELDHDPYSRPGNAYTPPLSAAA
ncbi:hypothetical protein [Sphingomonas sp. Leaf257]|uniref:hypothetical protein n=1 Tax=Sphingomonas sp. Leaf257 TaxID=1736309 RepID=UPI000AF6F496|nr:hypothetical protein [Sphingomonas sp. Leaf257]